MILDHVLYIRVKASLLSFKNITHERYYEDVPLLALSKTNNKVLAFGKSAEIYRINPNAKVVNGFEHSRSIIGNCEAAEKTLQQFIKQVLPTNLWRFHFRPIIILHPLEKLEGCLTEIEGRALIDCGYRIKAHKAFVWTGRVLTDDEVRHGKFLDEPELLK